jgi:hypothetical protein
MESISLNKLERDTQSTGKTMAKAEVRSMCGNKSYKHLHSMLKRFAGFLGSKSYPFAQ